MEETRSTEVMNGKDSRLFIKSATVIVFLALPSRDKDMPFSVIFSSERSLNGHDPRQLIKHINRKSAAFFQFCDDVNFVFQIFLVCFKFLNVPHNLF